MKLGEYKLFNLPSKPFLGQFDTKVDHICNGIKKKTIIVTLIEHLV